MIKTLANGYSSESAQRELSNEYQQGRVPKFFKNLWVLVLWTKVASAWRGLMVSGSYNGYLMVVSASLLLATCGYAQGVKGSLEKQ